MSKIPIPALFVDLFSVPLSSSQRIVVLCVCNVVYMYLFYTGQGSGFKVTKVRVLARFVLGFWSGLNILDFLFLLFIII